MQRNLDEKMIFLCSAFGKKLTFLKTVIFQHFMQRKLDEITIFLCSSIGHKWTFLKTVTFKKIMQLKYKKMDFLMQRLW
jgi:hypothetical protein